MAFSQIFSNEINHAKARWEEIKTEVMELFPELNMEEALSLGKYAEREFSYFMKGIVPISEGSYTLESPSDVCGFYRAFGLIPKVGDNPDSIHYEFEFMSILSLKIAFAPDEVKRDIAQSAYTKFFREHISRWIPKFCKRIKEENNLVFYKKISHILKMD